MKVSLATLSDVVDGLESIVLSKRFQKCLCHLGTFEIIILEA